MKIWILIAFCLMAACSDRRFGTCDATERITFRDISFSFPISAHDALRFSDKISYNQSEWIQTDSIKKNISAIWFFESHDNKFSAIDSVNYLKDALIYGVTFILWAELNKTDAQILEELQKNYPGHYEFVDQFGSQYYINRRGCMTIILKREWHYEKPFPSVSFCYGLSRNEGAYYGHKTGNKSGFD